MTDPHELKSAFAIARMYLDFLEEKLADGSADPATIRATLVKVVGDLSSHGRLPLRAGRGPRGLGYDLDEAMIMASLPDYGGSIETAARAHWAGQSEEMVDAKIRKLYRHKKEIEEAGMEFP